MKTIAMTKNAKKMMNSAFRKTGKRKISLKVFSSNSLNESSSLINPSVPVYATEGRLLRDNDDFTSDPIDPMWVEPANSSTSSSNSSISAFSMFL